MAASSGYDFKAKRVSGTTTPVDHHLGGIVTNATPEMRVDYDEQAATGQYQLAVQQTVAIYPRLRLEMKLQRLANFIADKDGTYKFCFVSAEGALSVYNLYVSDGIDADKWTTCLTDRCEVTIPIRGSIEASIDVLAKTATAQAYGSAPGAISDAILNHTNVNTLSIGETSIKTDFLNFRFSVSHNIQQEVLGTTLTPTEVLQRETKYSGTIRRALKTQSFKADAYAGTPRDIILQINDNQTTPVKTKLTWADAYFGESKVVRGLDMIIEEIPWRAKGLTIEAGS